MSTNKERLSSKERFWRRMVRQWRKSGLSVRAFCAERGLSEPSFYAWRRTFAERDATAVPFVPLTVTPELSAILESEATDECERGRRMDP